MTTADLIKCRLVNQHIAATKLTTAHEVVSSMCAMQSQEYAQAKWAIGLRLQHTTEAEVEKAFNDGKILRTHLLRPTWHFVTPENIRWLLTLTAPRVKAINASMYRKLELDDKIFTRSADTFIKALRDEKQLTRTALKASLASANIIADGLRLAYILMHAELDGIICSGQRVGKQFTYALLNERVPAANALTKQQSLAKLTLTYFTTRGPATLQDYATWSGLTMKEVKEGVELVKHELAEVIVDGQQYLVAQSAMDNALKATLQKYQQSTFLMPDYDEYGMSYKDRSAIFMKDHKSLLPPKPHNDVVSNHMIIMDGVIAGTWKRTEKNRKVDVETVPLKPLNKAQESAISKAANRYCSFTNNS